jgi:U3 small nucleolar RNA-associated protein 14
MVEGFLTTNSGIDQTPDYELPSQAELVRRVFAGDDVAAEFERDKLETLNEENPEPEKPALVPGWGQWTHVQKKKGLPDWMVREHEEKKRKREEALKKRKDAKFNHVIISENINKKVFVMSKSMVIRIAQFGQCDGFKSQIFNSDGLLEAIKSI